MLFFIRETTEKSKAGKPTPLILNAEGRTVDSSGNVVELIQRMPTLKANIRVQKKEQFIKLKQEKQTEETSDHRFFDQRVGLKSAIRSKRAFKFHEKGTFESLGQKLRTKVKNCLSLFPIEINSYFRLNWKNCKKRSHRLRRKQALALRHVWRCWVRLCRRNRQWVGFHSNPYSLNVRCFYAQHQTVGCFWSQRMSICFTQKEDDIPDIEWWDSFVLKDNRSDYSFIYSNSNVFFVFLHSYMTCIENNAKAIDKYDGITHLVEHPIQMKPPCNYLLLSQLVTLI